MAARCGPSCKLSCRARVLTTVASWTACNKQSGRSSGIRSVTRERRKQANGSPSALCLPCPMPGVDCDFLLTEGQVQTMCEPAHRRLQPYVITG
jgi:hypothetical protein